MKAGGSMWLREKRLHTHFTAQSGARGASGHGGGQGGAGRGRGEIGENRNVDNHVLRPAEERVHCRDAKP
jgi:hypothetical protein